MPPSLPPPSPPSSAPPSWPPPAVPVEPPPSRYVFPDPRTGVEEEGIVCVGGDFRAGTILSAYRRGIFPWPTSARVVPWCSPDPRALFPLETPNAWSRSLRRTLRSGRFRVTTDRAFGAVLEACADREGGTWITGALARGYLHLHELGWAHSVEVWNVETGALVGGLYGVAIGAAFAGESMFHRETDASKVAFVATVDALRAAGYALLDVQVMSPHLASLGCVEIPREEFLRRLATATTSPRVFPQREPEATKAKAARATETGPEVAPGETPEASSTET